VIRFVRVDIEILQRRDLGGAAKLLLALVRGFGAQGLTLLNPAIGEALGVRSSYVKDLLSQLTERKLVIVQKPRSRHRRIIYSGSGPGAEAPLLGVIAASRTKSTGGYSRQSLEVRTPTALIDNKNYTEAPQAPRVDEAFDRDDFFESWWTAYPKKRAKAAAAKAFRRLKLTPELADKIMAALEQQKKSADWLTFGGRFIPYPATWLNNCRWEDEMEPPEEPETRAATEDDLWRLGL